MILTLGAAGMDPNAATVLHRERFEVDHTPEARAARRVYNQLRETGSSANLPSYGGGQSRHAVSVLAATSGDPHASSRRITNEGGVGASTPLPPEPSSDTRPS